MSISPNKNENKKRNPVLYVLSGFLILFMIWFLFQSVSAPAEMVKHINSEFAYKKPEKGGLPDSLFYDSAFVVLGRQKAFLQARLAMSSEDSVSLSISIPDSLVTIEIKGVQVYRTKIISARISNVFSKADEYAVTSMLSRPLTVKKDVSTIRKEPVVHKVAPKDTTEYKPDAPPDTSRIEYVNFILLTKEGVKLYFFQSTEGNPLAKFHRFVFDISDRAKNAAGIISSMIHFRKPEYQPYIKITISRKSALIIYRALPYQGRIAVKR